MRQYRQLTEDDRIEIYAMVQAGKNQKQKESKKNAHKFDLLLKKWSCFFMPGRRKVSEAHP